MDENRIEEEKIVPNYALDIINANHHATLKKLWILVFTLVILLVGTNVAWVIYESQYEDVVTVTQENADGINNYIGEDGDITNGKTDDNKNTP